MSVRTQHPGRTPDAAGPALLGDALGHLAKVMERTGAHVASRRGDGVERAAFAVLFRLIVDGPQRSGALAEALFADPSTISRHVAQLVGLGLVERRADPVDGRATVLAATEAGTASARSIRERRNTALATVTTDWSPDDLTSLTTLLTRFTDDLEHHRPRMLADLEHRLGHEGER